MKIRIFNHYHNLPIALLAVVETLLILSAPLIVQTMLLGQSFASLLGAWPVTVPKILAFVLCIGVALTAMGLYNSRQRARTLGIILRAIVAHGLASRDVRDPFVLRARGCSLLPGHALAWATVSLSARRARA